MTRLLRGLAVAVTRGSRIAGGVLVNPVKESLHKLACRDSSPADFRAFAADPRLKERRVNRRDTALGNEASIANGLLAALPRAVYSRLLAASLEPVTLKSGEVLHEPGERIRYVYFPIDCVVALLIAVKGHQAVEVGLVGQEGMVGSPLALGVYTSSRRAMVHGTGTAMRMKSTLFRKEILQSKPLQKVLYRYKHALIGQIAQSAACKQFHSISARLARYLLIMDDCARSSEFRLTHEFMARALGVQRASVTYAAGDLQKWKLISYNHGRIRILDRKGLEAASCECYMTIKRIYDNA